jgi:hypothetical protein
MRDFNIGNINEENRGPTNQNNIGGGLGKKLVQQNTITSRNTVGIGNYINHNHISNTVKKEEKKMNEGLNLYTSYTNEMSQFHNMNNINNKSKNLLKKKTHDENSNSGANLFTKKSSAVVVTDKNNLGQGGVNKQK